ncbi:hypothetical protein K1719_038516 [Acacia pycnantha]|nr:hypothetical protein K1719_038516 [Acacia pycnantha]
MISAATSMLPQLRTLYISDCSQMEEVFKCSNIEHHDIDSDREIPFPNMKSMELNNLPRFVNVCQGFKFHTGELGRVKIHDCPKLMAVKSATIDWTKKRLVREYVLKYSQLNDNEALNLPLSILIAGELDIQSPRATYKCRIIGDDDQEETTNVGILRSEQQMLRELRELKVERCNKLKRLIFASTATIVSQLNYLLIAQADQLEVIFEHSSKDDVKYSETIVLSNLRKIELRDLPNFMSVCQVGLQIQVELRDIRVWECPKFVDSSFGSALQQLGSISELQKLQGHQLRNEEYKPLAAVERIQLDNCGVQSIFHYQTGFEEQIPTFQYLKELTLKKCARLKRVFSAYICQSLPELTTVTISCCEGLEAIFSGNEETLINLSITESCMLKLKSLKISECNKLKFILSFVNSTATSMLPQLSTLIVSDCSQMEEIFKFSNIEHDDIDSDREIMLPNMKHMELNNLPRFINICQRFKFHTRELGRVKIHDCPKFMPIKSATIDCTKERLVREYVQQYSQINDNEALNLPLSVLIAGELDIQSPRVEHKWGIIGDDEPKETNGSDMLRSEQQMLGGFVPTQLLSFQYLHSLEVIGSKNLKLLFSMSTIAQNSLPKLSSLTLSDCEELEVIFVHSSEDDANYSDTIVLSSLKMIEIRNLPNFKSVCQVGLQIQVELRHIGICNCPKFVDSSSGLALQQLGTLSVSTEDSNVETSSNVHVNEEKGMMIISTAEHLWLKSSMNLISVWEGPTFIKFQNLVELHVIKCRRLKCIFSSTVMRSLPCLRGLWIEACEELEEVMSSEEEEHSHFPNNSLCFPQLRTLEVIGCRKLNWLFPSLPSALLLPRLHWLTIKECSQLKGVCNSEVEIHEKGVYKKSLPKLKLLTIQDCPIFSETTLAALQSRPSNLPLTLGKFATVKFQEEDGAGGNNNKQLLVIKCRRLKCIMPSTVMRSLPCLRGLWISECEELEEIMSSGEEEHNHFPNESSNNSLGFPQLNSLEVIRCRKFKWLFPSLPSTYSTSSTFVGIDKTLKTPEFYDDDVYYYYYDYDYDDYEDDYDDDV